MAAKKENIPEIENEIPEQGERKVRIVLPFDDQAGDQFVSVNDRTWLIRRGEEVEVPECVFEVLRERDRAVMKAHAAAEQMRI